MSDITLSFDGKQIPLNLVSATDGNDGINIAPLLKETGAVTLDGGFTNTASCTSAITFIDGDAGILRYRGYPIEQLAEFAPGCSTIGFEGSMPYSLAERLRALLPPR